MTTPFHPILRRLSPFCFNDGLARLNRLALSMVEPRPGCSLLDLGCGDGSLTLEFASRLEARTIWGVELVAERVDACLEKGIRCKSFNLEYDWDFPDNTFDFVLSSQNIEHMGNTRKYLEEAFRVMKPGGVLIVLTENLASWANVFALLWGWQPFSTTNICGWSLGNPLIWHIDQEKDWDFVEAHRETSGVVGHVRVLTYCGLRDLLRQVGFSQITIRSTGWFPLFGPISDFVCRIDSRHGHFLLAKVVKPEA